MAERDPLWDGLKELAKRNHDERVAKTPQRINYAIEQLKKHNIRYELKNADTGHFHCWTKNNILVQFWAGTGKIADLDRARGINALIKYLEEE